MPFGFLNCDWDNFTPSQQKILGSALFGEKLCIGWVDDPLDDSGSVKS